MDPLALSPSSTEFVVIDNFRPFLVCVFLSLVAFGFVLVQLPTYLLAQAHSRRDSDRTGVCKRGMTVAISLLFVLVIVSSWLTWEELLTMFVRHYGEYAWAANLDERPQAPAIPAIALTIVSLCQLCLVWRCCAFPRALNCGRLPWYRWALAAVLAVVSVGSCIVGNLSQQYALVFTDSYAQEIAADGAGHPTFELLQGCWLATSLLVDLVLTATITFDLRQAMAFGRHDGAGGVQQDAREVLRAILLLTLRNGTIISLAQLVFLCIVVGDDSSWAHAAFVVLPPVQFSALLATLNQPHQVAQAQRNRAAVAGDEESCPRPPPHTAEGRHSPPPPSNCAARCTWTERGRRKLPACWAGKWKRSAWREKV